ncbi:hypothetical protein C2845_PM03G15420 [Panicum miliaceum]|uniref:DUF7595 domain-containing protein n=1 Tax=Panicum miliaceum TaxID=4540 RepID=A0A3L6TC93_PANMI|nr:hypothetical protein C2845_PM03G15420 [Panicum miliaceum]
MPGGGGGDGILRSPAPVRGRQQRRPKWLPLDVVTAIAARSDPATLVRCAATCRDARRRVVDDPGFRGRLRLRHTDRFRQGQGRRVPGRHHRGGRHQRLEPLDSRDGLLLVREAAGRLRVCDPATRRSQTCFPPETGYTGSGSYVLLVGDGEGGGAVERPFQVLKANLALSPYPRWRCLDFQTFSPEHDMWGPCTTILTPSLDGGRCHGESPPLVSEHSRPLVVGDVVHWLCLTDTGSYVLMLHVGAARVNVTTLPASFPRAPTAPPHGYRRRGKLVGSYSYLLATTSVGGSPIVLVASDERISAWEQSKHTKLWKQRPQVVIEKEAILRFGNVRELLQGAHDDDDDLELEWFAERSGAVLIRIGDCGFLWLDLQSKAIVKLCAVHMVRNLCYGWPDCTRLETGSCSSGTGLELWLSVQVNLSQNMRVHTVHEQ